LSRPAAWVEQFSELRKRAEAILEDRIAFAPSRQASLSAEDALRALHELSVHQIELEMQNEEMGATLAEVDAGRERYANFYDLSSVGFCSLSEAGLILEANLTLAGMLGSARAELVGQPGSRHVATGDRKEFRLRLDELFATGEPQDFDLRLVRLDGTEVWAHLAAVAALNAQRERVCRAVLSDITERKQAEEALLQSERTFRTLFASLGEGVALHELVVDAYGAVQDYRILDVNPAFRTHTGIDPLQARGRLGSELYGTPAPPYLEAYARVAHTGVPSAFETYFQPLAKHFRISVSSPGPGRFVTVFEDITESRREIAELGRLNAALEQRVEELEARLAEARPAAQDPSGR